MKSKHWPTTIVMLAVAATFTSACNRPANDTDTLVLATTTSTQESGLLDVLLPKFRQQTGIDVRAVAVGSGQALELGRRGDADVLLTHAPAAEQQFMNDGWGEVRRPLMYNDFLLVGPHADPANVKGCTSILDCFVRIAERPAPFVSRGDDSGTHIKEREIWQKAGQAPKVAWYVEAGSGMSHTLRLANEKRAYTLSDRATYLALRDELDLVIFSEGDVLLRNNYAVLVVNAKKHPHVNSQAARKFAEFLTDPETKEMIAGFGVDRFGEPLFVPANK